MVIAPIETIAVTAGFLNIYLAARNNIWNWLFGILTVSFYFVIFLNAKLYADMSLQLVFLFLQFYGIYQWLYGGTQRSARMISHAANNILCAAFFIAAVLFIMIAFLLQHFTDSTTVYADAFVTALSLTAQWMMSKKWLEHWWLWIVVDVVSIQLYFSKGLYFTAGLYVVFLGLCVLGYRVWAKQCGETHLSLRA